MSITCSSSSFSFTGTISARGGSSAVSTLPQRGGTVYLDIPGVASDDVLKVGGHTTSMSVHAPVLDGWFHAWLLQVPSGASFLDVFVSSPHYTAVEVAASATLAIGGASALSTDALVLGGGSTLSVVSAGESAGGGASTATIAVQSTLSTTGGTIQAAAAAPLVLSASTTLHLQGVTIDSDDVVTLQAPRVVVASGVSVTAQEGIVVDAGSVVVAESASLVATAIDDGYVTVNATAGLSQGGTIAGATVTVNAANATLSATASIRADGLSASSTGRADSAATYGASHGGSIDGSGAGTYGSVFFPALPGSSYVELAPAQHLTTHHTVGSQ